MEKLRTPMDFLNAANTLYAEDRKKRALKILALGLMNKRYKKWQKIYDSIISKYLLICIEFRNIHFAKMGLNLYRNKCLPDHIQSLGTIVIGYLAAAEEKIKTTIRNDSQQVVANIDDLEEVQLLENLVSTDDAAWKHIRKDVNDLTLSVNFLWQSYRVCLLLLLNTAHTESLYNQIAQRAFCFCLNYDRKTELQKLFGDLKSHFQHIIQHQDKKMSVNLKQSGNGFEI